VTVKKTGQTRYIGNWNAGLEHGIPISIPINKNLGLGIEHTNRIRRYQGNFKFGHKNGWGTIENLVPNCKDTWQTNYRGQFKKGNRLGWGIFHRPSDGIRVKTYWIDHKTVSGKDIMVYSESGNLIAEGRIKKRLGRILN
jgi:hypothetical protein